MSASGSSRPPFFSTPLAAAETERLRNIVDRRVAMRRDVDVGPVPRIVTATEFRASTIDRELRALHRALVPALFDVRRGGVVARAAKRIANLVLGVLGQPQRYVNAAVQVTLESTARMIERMDDESVRMGACLAQLDERLAELERHVIATEHARARATSGQRVSIGGGSDGRVRVDGQPGPGIAVVADAGRLPFAPRSLAELVVSGPATASAILSEWLPLLVDGGRLRVTCPDVERAPRLVDDVVAARAMSGESARLTVRLPETGVIEIVVHEVG